MYKFTNINEPWNIKPIKSVSFSSDTKNYDGMILEARVLEAIIHNYIFKCKKFDSLVFSKLYNYVTSCSSVDSKQFLKKLTDLINDLVNRLEEIADDEDYTPAISFSSGNYKMYIYKDHTKKVKNIADIINIYYQAQISFNYI